MARRPWQIVDGVILLDKPIGLSSNDALQRVRRAFSAKKAGHGGTLDPLATGVLPIAFGAATRFLHDLVEAEKTYTATLRLGLRSSTGDGEGELSPTAGYQSGRPDFAQVQAVLPRFTGLISQRPPMYSALKHKGRPLYEYARAGIKIDLPEREITIHELSVVSTDIDEIRLRVRCSKGTYIRVLAEDIGDAFGSGAYLVGLRRDAVGRFDLSQSWTLATIESAATSLNDSADSEGALERSVETAPIAMPALLPVDAMVRDLPEVALDDLAARQFTNGQAIAMSAAIATSPLDGLESVAHEPIDGRRWRVYNEGRFLGLAKQQQQTLNPFRVLQASESVT